MWVLAWELVVALFEAAAAAAARHGLTLGMVRVANASWATLTAGAGAAVEFTGLRWSVDLVGRRLVIQLAKDAEYLSAGEQAVLGALRQRAGEQGLTVVLERITLQVH